MDSSALWLMVAEIKKTCIRLLAPKLNEEEEDNGTLINIIYDLTKKTEEMYFLNIDDLYVYIKVTTMCVSTSTCSA